MRMRPTLLQRYCSSGSRGAGSRAGKADCAICFHRARCIWASMSKCLPKPSVPSTNQLEPKREGDAHSRFRTQASLRAISEWSLCTRMWHGISVGRYIYIHGSSVGRYAHTFSMELAMVAIYAYMGVALVAMHIHLAWN